MAIKNLDISLVIMAAGSSQRFSSLKPKAHRVKKQWLRIDKLPLWQKVANDFRNLYKFKEILIVASKEDAIYMQKNFDFSIIVGGQTRQQSVQNALNQIQTPLVLISDAARWNLDKQVLENIFEAFRDDIDCVAPYLNVADTTLYKDSYLNREELKLIQTPQLCKTQVLKQALLKDEFSDESSAIAAFEGKVAYVKGSSKLNKLTYQDDLEALKALPSPQNDIFIGNGFDVHPFETGKKMILGGVEIDAPFGFRAHSDGDVVLHALSDALLGAIGGGDIGEWFPDDDVNFKNIDSKILLQQIYDFAISIGFELINADITIIAQTPKIAPYKDRMRQIIADLLYTQKSNINIKATTTENLGFVGRKEGISVNASAAMKFINWKE